MTPFVVEWLDEAVDELAAVWLRARDRPAVTRASAMIDTRLSRDPIGFGSQLNSNLWHIQVMPLLAAFEIDRRRSLVRVLSIKLVADSNNGQLLSGRL